MQNTLLSLTCQSKLYEYLSLVLEGHFDLDNTESAEMEQYFTNLDNSDYDFYLLFLSIESLTKYPETIKKLNHKLANDAKVVLITVKAIYVEITEKLGLHPNSLIIHEEMAKDSINKEVTSYLQIQDSIKNRNTYLNISPNYLLKHSTTPCDIFIKINEDKYVKIISSNHEFHREKLLDYIKKGCDYFYINAAGYNQLSEDLCDYYDPKFLQQFQDGMASPMQLNLETQTFILESIKALGLDPLLLELTNKHILNIVENFKNINIQNVTLKSFLQKGNYRSDHSILVSYICCSIAEEMGLSRPETLWKLCLAAFFHDIAIKNTALDNVINLEKNNRGNIDYKLREEYFNHPQKACEYLDKLNGIPDDVLTIIMQHHERHDGNGFPRGLTANRIHPLSLIFIISHEVTGIMYSKKQVDQKKLIKSLSEKYNDTKFIEIVEGLGSAMNHTSE